MGRDISRTARMTYEKFDKDSWMVTPRYEEVPSTSFLDVRKLSTLNNKSKDSCDDIDIANVLKEAINRFG